MRMRANQKFTEPASVKAGVLRHRRLGYECRKIERQLGDATRPQWKYGGDASAYEAWRKKAERALELFRAEEHQLGEWLRGELHEAAWGAYALLRNLQEDCGDFTKEEVAIVDRLGNYVEALDAVVQCLNQTEGEKR